MLETFGCSWLTWGTCIKGHNVVGGAQIFEVVLGVSIPEGLISDPQLRGRAQRLMASKAIYKPARPLKAKEVAALEQAMTSDLDVRDIYMLSAIIFAVLSRSRWSDLRFVDQFWVERAEFNGQPFGFVEARTKFHKTASLAKKQRHMFCPTPDGSCQVVYQAGKTIRSVATSVLQIMCIQKRTELDRYIIH